MRHCEIVWAFIFLMGSDLDLHLETDSSAAVGMISKVGLQKTKHLDTKTLWIQQALMQGKFRLRKIDGTTNPANLLTKHLDFATMVKHMRCLGLEFRAGRAAAPQLADGAARVRLQMVLMGMMLLMNLGETKWNDDHLMVTTEKSVMNVMGTV